LDYLLNNPEPKKPRKPNTEIPAMIAIKLAVASIFSSSKKELISLFDKDYSIKITLKLQDLFI